jgi:hypothetical protein
VFLHPPPPPPLVRGEDTLAAWRGGGGSIIRKTPDTGLFSPVYTKMTEGGPEQILIRAVLQHPTLQGLEP